ncbi:hypothetical protein ACFQX7_33425 [Luedemannella flava]
MRFRRLTATIGTFLILAALVMQVLSLLVGTTQELWSPDTALLAAGMLPMAWALAVRGALALADRLVTTFSASEKVRFIVACGGIGACLGSGYAWSWDGWEQARAYGEFLINDTQGGWPALADHVVGTMPLGLLFAGTVLFPIVLADAVAPRVMNWWSQRIWLADPQLAAQTDLIYVFTMLRGELSLADPDTKIIAIRRLQRASRAVERGLPRTIPLGNGPARQTFADRCRVAGRSIDALSVWVALPRQDTHLVLRGKLAASAAALVTGRYDELPADPPLAEVCRSASGAWHTSRAPRGRRRAAARRVRGTPTRHPP